MDRVLRYEMSILPTTWFAVWLNLKGSPDGLGTDFAGESP